MKHVEALRFLLIIAAVLSTIFLSIGHGSWIGWVGSAGMCLIIAHLILILSAMMIRFRHTNLLDVLIDGTSALLGAGALISLPNLVLCLALLAASYQFLSLRSHLLVKKNTGLIRREAAVGLNRAAPLAILFGLSALLSLLFSQLTPALPSLALIAGGVFALIDVKRGK